MENIKKTCESMVLLSVEPLVNQKVKHEDGEQRLCFSKTLSISYQRVDFMTSGVAKGPRAATETDPRHIPEVCPALD